MNICLYGASSSETSKSYISRVEQLGEKLALRGHTLVFGGGAQGLMGAAVRGATRCGGRSVGVAPSFLNVDGILFQNCTELIYTDTMRDRKQIMEDRAEAFITVPGGIGTFEEFFEILTLKQLGRHNKPIVIFNLDGYYENMQKMLETAIEQNFMKPACRELYMFCDDPDAALDYIESYDPAAFDIRHLKNI